MKNKICVYTCMTGDYDSIKEIPNKEPGIDYYFFTNNKNIKSKTWKVVYIEDNNLSNVQLARRTKILGTEEINNKYDILVWMDAAVTFKKPIKEFIDTYYKDTSFLCFKHGERDNIKDEISACYRHYKEDKDKLTKLMKFYEKENYQYDNGLIESTVYIKNPKDKKVMETMKLWFDMIMKYTKRDQLSFNYCISKTGLEVKWINEKVFDNKWFLWENHSINHNLTTYSVYYGNIDDKYDMDLDYHYNYKIDNNKYIIKYKSALNSDITYINLNCLPGTAINILKVNNIKKYEIYNYIDFKDKKVFINTFPFIVIKEKIKANELITIELELTELDEAGLLDLISKLGHNNIDLTLKKYELESIIKQKDEEIKYLSERVSIKLYRKIKSIFKR